MSIQANAYQEYMLSVLKEILGVDSPTGFSKAVNEKLCEMLSVLGYAAETSNKRLVKVRIKGKSSEKKIAISAHVDTLGAMVKNITGDGKIRFTKLGGPILPLSTGNIAAFTRTAARSIRARFYPIARPVTYIKTQAQKSEMKIPCT